MEREAASYYQSVMALSNYYDWQKINSLRCNNNRLIWTNEVVRNGAPNACICYYK